MADKKELSEGKKLEESLFYKKENFFEVSSEEKIEAAYDYAEGYKKFLDESKTEREAVRAATAYAESKGYSEYKFGDKLSAGDKKYRADSR